MKKIIKLFLVIAIPVFIATIFGDKSYAGDFDYICNQHKSSVARRICGNARNETEAWSSDVGSGWREKREKMGLPADEPHSAVFTSAISWFSLRGSKYTDDKLTAAANTDQISILLRGSAVTNKDSTSGREYYMSNINVKRAGKEILKGGYIYVGNTSLLEAGHFTEDQIYQYKQHPPSELSLELDISHINPGETGRVYLDVYRCISHDGVSVANLGTCGESTWVVYVTKDPLPWTAEGQSYVNNYTTKTGDKQPLVSAKPGDTVRFRHSLANNSKYKMYRSIDVEVQHGEIAVSAGWPHHYSPLGPSSYSRANPGETIFLRGAIGIYNDYNRKVTQGDVGKRLCQRVSWSPGSGSVGHPLNSNWACVDVPYEYELTPTIRIDNEITENTETVNGIHASIVNSGPTMSKKASYAVARFVVRKGSDVQIPGSDNVHVTLGGNWPCDVAREIGRRNGLSVDDKDCRGKELIRSDDGMEISSELSLLSGKSNDISDISGLSAGDSVCYVSMVNEYKHSGSRDTFRYSRPSCVVIAKKPKVQVWGSDVLANDGVVTSISNTGKKTMSDGEYHSSKPSIFGSWSEYGIMSSGRIISSSGAGLSTNGAAGREAMDALDYNQLTFANAKKIFGHYGRMVPSRDLASFFSGGEDVHQSQLDIGEISGKKVYRRKGDLQIKGGVLRSGSSAALIVDGTVTIDDDIVYDNAPHKSLYDIPQLVIIAKNIIIKDNVSRVDGWLVGNSDRGEISTCNRVYGNPYDGLTSEVCNKPLLVNGPVRADKLHLRRTAGAERESPGEPAEILNTRPDAYLWSYGRSIDNGIIKTMHLKELPPRF